ncbi:MAG: ArsR family transcriptional regulator [Oscillospiraceae bacterium]|nr:ArsR family transcriptional regulator [Oscillospiraceae bacterium]
METQNTILQQIQQNIEALQKQIDSMKQVEPETEIQAQDAGLRAKLKKKSEELAQIMEEMVSPKSAQGENSGACASLLFSISGPKYGSTCDAAFYFAESADKIGSIDENGLASAVEAFSNPKRINILKLLISKKNLSSSELTMKTGCIGGQLYHHLSILENTRIICKNGGMYTLTDYGRNTAIRIFGMVFGETLK